MKYPIMKIIALAATFLVPGGSAYAETAESRVQSGIAKSQAGDPNGAVADFTRAIELDPKSVLAYRNRGVVRGTLGDYQGSAADETRAIELDPTSPLSYYARGLARDMLGDRKGAAEDFRQSALRGDADAEKWLTDHGYSK